MSDYLQETLSTRHIAHFDVIITGGGIGGVAAALAARRAGCSVLLLEKSVMLGGLATLGLIDFYEPLCDGRGNIIHGGIARELFDLAIRYGSDTLDKAWLTPGGVPPRGRCTTQFSPGILVFALDELMQREGVDLLFDTLVVRPVLEQGRCTGLVVENKTGRGYYTAGMVIDATGDAELLCKAGLPCEVQENLLTYVAHMIRLAALPQQLEREDAYQLRERRSIGANAWGKGHPEGVKTFLGTTAEEITEYILTGRRLFFETFKESDRRQRDVIALPGMAQMRTLRRLQGAYTLTKEDLGRPCADSIGVVSDFQYPGDLYEVPYRTLYHPAVGNMLAAGRCVSAGGRGWEVMRVIPSVALTGQAAGLAAALALRAGRCRSCRWRRCNRPWQIPGCGCTCRQDIACQQRSFWQRQCRLCLTPARPKPVFSKMDTHFGKNIARRFKLCYTKATNWIWCAKE